MLQYEAVWRNILVVWTVAGKGFSYICRGTNRWIFSGVTGIAWNV